MTDACEKCRLLDELHALIGDGNLGPEFAAKVQGNTRRVGLSNTLANICDGTSHIGDVPDVSTKAGGQG